eukprot:6172878-Pleurochrysis_carterae.AAC.1
MIISYIIPTINGQGASASAGAGRAYGWLRVGGAQARSAMRATETLTELRERSASAPQVRMRRDCNLGNSACEYGFANEKRGRRQFVSNRRARARAEMVLFMSRGQTKR